jgi:hypothetical protein
LQPAVTRRVFLLSPANAGGERARMVRNESAEFDLAVKLRRNGAELGEVFRFVSGLYFRGKLAYAAAFSAPPPGVPGALVITAGRGLVPPEARVTLADLHAIAGVPIDAADPRYRLPLESHARVLEQAAGPDCAMILLGSIATTKYIEPLLEIFGERLLFPAEFVGRGDMSRGGLMLRCARAGVELTYLPVALATRRGPRPPRLPRLKRDAP